MNAGRALRITPAEVDGRPVQVRVVLATHGAVAPAEPMAAPRR